MREILFRGKRIDNGEWVYGWYMEYPFGRWPLKPCIVPSELACDGELRHCEVDPSTVGQYTGFDDKNGKKIFENDIVKSDWGYGELNTKVEFRDIFFADNECTISENIEVIGNIFDNPDLLGGSK
jgi:uncharacterized phage protein (TIGR01671 family)